MASSCAYLHKSFLAFGTVPGQGRPESVLHSVGKLELRVAIDRVDEVGGLALHLGDTACGRGCRLRRRQAVQQL